MTEIEKDREERRAWRGNYKLKKVKGDAKEYNINQERGDVILQNNDRGRR